MAALAAGVFGGIDPLLCLTRAGVALALGSVLGALWQALLGSSPVSAAPAREAGTDARVSADE